MYVYTLPPRIVADIVKTLHAESQRQYSIARESGDGTQALMGIQLDNLAQELAECLALVVVSNKVDGMPNLENILFPVDI
jgi:hypothetical protein